METVEKLSVLSVDDDPSFLRMLGMLITGEFKAAVDTAADCDTARTAFGSSQYDLVTLDYQLPDGDGLELLKEIMVIDHEPVVIMITGQGDEAIAARAFMSGASGYIVKDNRLATMFKETVRRAIALKHARNSVRDSEIRFRRLFEAAKDGILILDVETGLITDVNPFLVDLLGFPIEEIVGKGLWDIGPFRNVDATKEMFLELQQRKYVRYEDLPLETRDGRTIDVEFVCNVYVAGAKDVIQCNIRDIRPRKQRELRDKLRTEELDRYTRTVSHDLRSPIARIGMAATLLEKKLKGLPDGEIEEEAIELIDLIKGSVESAFALIQDLLSLARIGLAPESIESVDVKASIGSVLEEMEPSIRKEGADIEVGDDMGRVAANRTHILQVFSNLIKNALENAGGGQLKIQVLYLGRGEEGAHRYLVRDNGPGMPEGIIDDVFLPFVSAKADGTGMGLAIVSAIVRTYGGGIRAYNDQGACIEFTLKDFEPES